MNSILFKHYVPLSDDINTANFSIDSFPSKVSNYSYTLKLAMRLRPKDTMLHDWILSKMDFGDFKLLQFEILCLIAECKGCNNEHFKELFDRKLWLLGGFEERNQEIRDAHCNDNKTLTWDSN